MEPFPILLVDHSGRINRANIAAVQRFGEIVGRTCAEVVGALENGRVMACTGTCADKLAHLPGGGVREIRGRVGEKASHVICSSFDGGLMIQVLPDPVAERPHVPLSNREREVVGLVAHGFTGKEVAERLGLSPATVRTHVENAMQRMGAANRAELVALSVAMGIAKLDPALAAD